MSDLTMPERYRGVGAVIPVVDGKIILCKRGSEPFKGMYGAVSGKNDAAKAGSVQIQTLVRQGECSVKPSITDEILSGAGLELIATTAVREFCEEMYHGRQVPADYDIGRGITDFAQIGFVEERFPGDNKLTEIYFFLAVIKNKDFTPSAREISQLMSLENIREEEILMATKIALMHIKWRYDTGAWSPAMQAYRNMHLDAQIPDYKIDRSKPRDMILFPEE